MLNLRDFLSLKPETIKPMTVRQIDKNGTTYKVFEVPQGFQLERYVDALYPENEIMAYQNNHEVNVTVFEKNGWDPVEIFIGVFK